MRDVAGHDFSVRLNSNHESAAIIAKQRFQIGSFIFGMIFLGKHELNRVLPCERRVFVSGNKNQFRRLIIPLENAAYFRIGRAQSYCAQPSDNDRRKDNEPLDRHLRDDFSAFCSVFKRRPRRNRAAKLARWLHRALIRLHASPRLIHPILT